MKQWEYKLYYADGENEDTLDELNELGEEGWELVTKVINDGINNGYLVFKREK
tara:strand:+ start:290 stop:448 length:159 start_codon:yes stop_codon:yes gene_type:complete